MADNQKALMVSHTTLHKAGGVLTAYRGKLKWALVAIALYFSSACVPTATSLPPLPSDTPLPPTATPTATRVWFPPTPTSTPFPTAVVTPTLDLSPPVGEIILEDDFSDSQVWSLGKTGSGTIAIAKNELTLAINQPGGYLFSLRKRPNLGDFYAEITTAPTLCKNTDEYGVLLRVSESLEFYRYSLSCDGQVRLDKYFNGRASSPQPWMVSGAVPPGAPSQSRLGVWASGEEMRFYVNGHHQFTIRDPALSSGSIGVFARSAGDNAVTIAFTDLVIRKIQ